MRRQDWKAQVCDFAENIRGEAFAWGSTDCISLTLHCMTLMYDDPAHILSIEWSDEAMARDTLRRITPERYLVEFGAMTKPLEAIACGDIITGERGGLPQCHFVVGRQILTSFPTLGVRVVRPQIEALKNEACLAWALP